MLEVHPLRAFHSSIEAIRQLSWLRVSAAIIATTCLSACGTTDPMEEQSISANPGTETISEPPAASAMPAPSSMTPVGMSEPDTEAIMELPTIMIADVDPATEEPEQGTVELPVEVQNQGSVGCTAEPAVMRDRMLQLINDARSQARFCGTESFAATQPLAWNTTLAAAARTHSEDMATHNFFSHTGSDGSSHSERVSVAGYAWRTVGENIAAGRQTATKTVSDWLDSPGHCRNIMNPSYSEVAVACVEDAGSYYSRYWTNVLAAPR